MKKKTIRCNLSSDSIDRAIKEIEEYKLQLEEKHKEFIKKLADKGITVAEKRYSEIKGDSETPSVSMTVSRGGYTATILISGPDVLFAEFGAGIHFNNEKTGPATKNAEKLGYSIGGYGKGLGKHHGWHHHGGILSQGTEAADATGRIELELRNDVQSVVKEVYG